jgi:hypothetical protein
MKVVTNFWLKPVPSRRFDWSAIDDDTYDGAPDSRCPVGYGKTEEDAIADLMQQIEDVA